MTKQQAESLPIGARVVIWPGTPHEATGTLTNRGEYGDGYSLRFFLDDLRKHSVIHSDDTQMLHVQLP